MPLVPTRAGTLAYHVRGSGPTVVLLPAALHDHHDFDAVSADLARHHRVVAVDWPGCGDSPPAPDPHAVTAPVLADGLEDLVAGLGEEPVVLIGNSVGGFAAARLAIRRPHRVAGLVLVNTGGFLPINPIMRLFCRTLGTPQVARRILPAFIRLYMQADNDLARAARDRAVTRAKTTSGVAMTAALWRSFATDAHDLRRDADKLTAPALIVWGSRDTAIPLPIGRATHTALPRARFETLPTGHVPFASAPQDFLAILRPFLTRTLGTTAGSPHQ
ncbi:alpha/beta fold hydrolase [Mycolicibacterium vanbaalenii]|uniref:Alpha/beta hydrolase fold protein n=1 Tax=Mycolicibacterium vanbaalenii (strain DSM 7251 / JCM 13017 / BCRC 16820 / KCTC 9966 / NRRL B-24157 / PYR-1) TaxID=350058 RepID=A1THJ7_MYCVP|nr:alpha/beta hydrolase [Mycolicibacterium vanbaalenii]ABM16647.1 alpha/beta hydrolase fold protein [Mycolicibacterium vanbaalenii PYR-1]MCV7130955.1 alpha/beta hydrolase [Mycolicibacterium vanbaalenii PYR-1]